MQSNCPSKGVQNDLKIAGVLGALQVDILAFFFFSVRVLELFNHASYKMVLVLFMFMSNSRFHRLVR